MQLWEEIHEKKLHTRAHNTDVKLICRHQTIAYFVYRNTTWYEYILNYLPRTSCVMFWFVIEKTFSWTCSVVQMNQRCRLGGAGGAFAPPDFEKMWFFCVFAHKILFLHILPPLPPLGSRSKFCPPPGVNWNDVPEMNRLVLIKEVTSDVRQCSRLVKYINRHDNFIVSINIWFNYVYH